ncbi:MAG: polysaccharide biosynthesis C-terminal domain-containing protein, partial [Oscillospiraceae bacterium]|nr:polysaccharide biosynthesis C-terminal domain-containing protein [Oscillospiraceae bacterium]
VCKNMQKHLTTISLFAAIANVMMNCLLIPAIGIDGAALASVMVQFFTCFVVPIFIKGMRPNIRLMVEAFLLKNVFKEK